MNPAIGFIIAHQPAILTVCAIAAVIAMYRVVCHQDRDLYPPRRP